MWVFWKGKKRKEKKRSEGEEGRKRVPLWWGRLGGWGWVQSTLRRFRLSFCWLRNAARVVWGGREERRTRRKWKKLNSKQKRTQISTWQTSLRNANRTERMNRFHSGRSASTRFTSSTLFSLSVRRMKRCVGKRVCEEWCVCVSEGVVGKVFLLLSTLTLSFFNLKREHTLSLYFSTQISISIFFSFTVFSFILTSYHSPYQTLGWVCHKGRKGTAARGGQKRTASKRTPQHVGCWWGRRGSTALWSRKERKWREMM